MNATNYEELSKQNWDVLIVGAGPGGLIAARECAKKGLTTLCIDRKQEIGNPVRCGEGLGEGWMKFADLKYNDKWCLQAMHGCILYGPTKVRMVIPTATTGYIVDRKAMEKDQAYQAVRAGAKLMMKTRVYDVIKEGSRIVGVKVESFNGKFDIRAKLVIAADGVDSQTAKYAGINTFSPASEVDAGYEYEMEGLNFTDSDKIHLYLGNDVAPRGYLWIFPKSATAANVGIGIIGTNDKNAKHYLDRWIATKPEIFKDASIVEIKGGCCPVGRPLEQLAYDGFILVGDAGHMINAIHGGGMGTAMESAMLAAEVAEKAIKAGDFSEKFLTENYTKKWYEKRGNQLLEVLKVRHFFEKLNDEQMEAMAELFTPEALLEFADGQKLKFFAKAFMKQPGLMLLATKTILIG